MTGHEHWDEQAAGYALHGLAPEEEAEFLKHLETCPECTEGLAQHELVAAQLGSISHYQESDQPPSWESMRDAIIGARVDDQEVVDLSARRRRYNVSRRVLAVAAAIVLVAGGIVIWRFNNGGSSSCSASAGCQQIQLDAAGGQTLASATVKGDDITVTPTNMPNAPAGKTYVLWQLPRGGAATPIGEFTAGTGSPATVSLHDPLTETEAFAVSLESAAAPPPATPSDTLATGTTT